MLKPPSLTGLEAGFAALRLVRVTMVFDRDYRAAFLMRFDD